MSYSFDIVGIAPVWNFFKYQQQVEQSPDRGCAYVGSYKCTLDSFIESTAMVHRKPDWDWDRVAAHIVNFWLENGDRVSQWKKALQQAEETNLVIGRVTNSASLRSTFERLLEQ